MKFLSKASKRDLNGTAVLRLDFNTADDWRMRVVLPTIKFLLARGCKILILSHKGRPKGIEPKLSLRKDARRLGKLISEKVVFLPSFKFAEIKKILDRSKKGSVFVLENIRFLQGEGQNSISLAKKLANLGDFYVNDAFSVSHRSAVSVDSITNFLPSFAGFTFEREIKNLSRVMKKPKRPLIIIIGGGKAEDKVAVVKHFKNRADWFLFGGASANTLLHIRGVNIGKSMADRASEAEFKEILSYKGLLLPTDFKISDNRILDIGKKSVLAFSEQISKAGTVVWNGPLGLMEKKAFASGTLGVARAIVRNRKSFSVAGGGETVFFLRKHKLDKYFDFISTGGGAMLDFLADKKLPGIEALNHET